MKEVTSENPPSKNGRLSSEGALPLPIALSIFQGVLLIVLGISFYGMVFSGGGLSLNGSGQGGLILVLTSLQVLALGSIVGLQLRRTWGMILIGTIFAALGIIAVISPGGVVASVNTLWIGVSNLVSGVLAIAGILGQIRQGTGSLPSAAMAPAVPLFNRMYASGLITGIAIIVFGLSMLVPTLLPSILGVVGFFMIFPGILIIMGLLLLYMQHITWKLQQMMQQGEC